MWAISVLLLTAAGAAAQQADPYYDTNQASSIYSVEKEVSLGQTYATDLRQRSRMIVSPVIVTYVQRVGQRLVSQMPSAMYPYRFEVTADDPGGFNEPYAMPGGYIFVPAGLLLSAQSEEEFAGMLAHSIGHVAQRHGTRNATGGQAFVFGGARGISLGANGRVPPAVMGNSRAWELEADKFGAGLLGRAGYGSTGLALYLRRNQGTQSTAMPDLNQRVYNLEQPGQAGPRPGSISNTDFLSVQRELRGTINNVPLRRPGPQVP